MRACVVGMCLVVASGCTATYAQLPAGDAPDACYVSGDTSRYNNFYLRFKGDGTYTATLQGDVGEWGSAAGNWHADHARVMFAPATETGVMKGSLKSVEKKRGNGFRPAALSFWPGWTNLQPKACS
jgi:hypothetical protein